jgi:hypothetical protein
VKLISRANDQLRFQLGQREKDLLLQVLSGYPRVPSSYQRLTKGQELDPSNQRLLDESLAEARSRNKKSLQTLLEDPQRLGQHEGHWRLTLSHDELEWLLQVLNDVRVGSWIHLGSPETPLKVLDAESAPDVWAMEMAGFFQMRLLEMVQA